MYSRIHWRCTVTPPKISPQEYLWCGRYTKYCTRCVWTNSSLPLSKLFFITCLVFTYLFLNCPITCKGKTSSSFLSKQTMTWTKNTGLENMLEQSPHFPVGKLRPTKPWWFICGGGKHFFFFYKDIKFLKGLGHLVLCDKGACFFSVFALFKILNPSFWSHYISRFFFFLYLCGFMFKMRKNIKNFMHSTFSSSVKHLFKIREFALKKVLACLVSW